MLPAFFGEDGATAGAIVYLLLLLWVFLGVAIVSDCFMSAIEVITSQEKTHRHTCPDTGQERTLRIKVWNDTIANLTLMALGSSAPEILLSVIELLGNDWFSGALGPSTVVGSAAFNLFVISGICIWCIKGGDIRKIDGTMVYAVTCSFSILAYLWLIVILMLITPDVVTLTEGLITFLMFPVLVGLAFAVDKNLCFQKNFSPTPHMVYASMDSSHPQGDAGDGVEKKAIAKLRRSMLDDYPDATEDMLMKVVSANLLKQERKSRAYYKCHAVRDLAGGKKSLPASLLADAKVKAGKVNAVRLSQVDEFEGTTVEWICAEYAVLEGGELEEATGKFNGKVKMQIVRSDTEGKVKVHYQTVDGDAKAGEDYVATEGDIVFEEGESSVNVSVTLIDDDQNEPDEHFFVVLSAAEFVGGNSGCRVQVGSMSRCKVTIIDDDLPGFLQFAKDDVAVREGVDLYAVIEVERRGGAAGEVACEYACEDLSASAGKDYKAVEGTLIFASSETQRQIKIPIIDDDAYEKDECFKVVLTNCSGGAQFTEGTQGGKERCECRVKIKNNDNVKENVNALSLFLEKQREAHRVGTSNYATQFTEAIYVGGSKESQAEASIADWIMHLLSVFWKVFFALIPPTDFAQGWLCFFVALGMIGLVTCIVGDLASFLGCSMGLEDEITAITLVALGTSLPDTFASKSAAEQDPYADASIGNVTGSNSVNVFLGLGLPWSMGAIYWGGMWETRKDDWLKKTIGATTQTYEDYGMLTKYPNGGFVVVSGALGFSVGVFSTLAVVCVLFLVVRRKLYGGELGGPVRAKNLSTCFCISLWFAYIMISIMQIKGVIVI